MSGTIIFENVFVYLQLVSALSHLSGDENYDSTSIRLRLK